MHFLNYVFINFILSCSFSFIAHKLKKLSIRTVRREIDKNPTIYLQFIRLLIHAEILIARPGRNRAVRFNPTRFPVLFPALRDIATNNAVTSG